jgi:predicted metal-dependent hydrolase
MPASSSITWSSVRFKALAPRGPRQLATHPDLPVPLLLCANRQARRMRLRFDERERVLKLTHPRGVRPAAAIAWAVTQKRWIEEQLESALPAEPLAPGAIIPIDGADVELSWSEAAPRSPMLVRGKLVCGGPETGFARRIERFLKRLALETLSNETAEFAARTGVRPTSVRVGDAKTRWGSCSSTGAIRYSWRLILAPPAARRYVVAHEVAHLTHLDHGKAFKLLERELFDGDVAAAERLLREAAPRLRRIRVPH